MWSRPGVARPGGLWRWWRSAVPSSAPALCGRHGCVMILLRYSQRQGPVSWPASPSWALRPEKDPGARPRRLPPSLALAQLQLCGWDAMPGTGSCPLAVEAQACWEGWLSWPVGEGTLGVLTASLPLCFPSHLGRAERGGSRRPWILHARWPLCPLPGTSPGAGGKPWATWSQPGPHVSPGYI